MELAATESDVVIRVSMEQRRKLWFFEDTVKLAELSVFPLVDKQAAISFMQLFCHRLNDILQKEGEEAVMELIFYGNAIKKENRAFRDYRSEKGGVKYVYKDPNDPTKGIVEQPTD